MVTDTLISAIRTSSAPVMHIEVVQLPNHSRMFFVCLFVFFTLSHSVLSLLPLSDTSIDVSARSLSHARSECGHRAEDAGPFHTAASVATPLKCRGPFLRRQAAITLHAHDGASAL